MRGDADVDAYGEDHRRHELADLLRSLGGQTGVPAAQAPFMTMEFYRAMMEADVNEALREFELPHVVVCFDPQSGHLTVEGPFDDGLQASRVAEEDASADQLVGTGFTYLVLPLLPRRDQG